VTAPEGRARENEWSGRPHRLREAGPWHCDPRRAGGATRRLRPPHVVGSARASLGTCRRARPERPGDGTQRAARAANDQGDLDGSAPRQPAACQPDADFGSSSGDNSSLGRWRPKCSCSRHSSNGGQPGPPARTAVCFGTQRVGSLTAPALVLGPARRVVRRCPARTCTPQGVRAPGGRCGARIETPPATRRTPWSAAGCNRPAPRVRSKPSKS
jgi:hypothetical protein